MDSLTQIVLGAAVAEALVGRKIENRALLYGAALGTLPDLDIFVGKLFDPITALEIHRGFSHSIVFFMLLSPLMGVILQRFERHNSLRWNEAATMAFLVLLTHALLDIFTTWGTQLLWPLPHRFALKTIFVVDPLYTLPLLYYVLRIIKIDKNEARRLKFIVRGLKISTVYLIFTGCIKLAVLNKFESNLAENHIVYHEIIVKPTPFNIILWNANVKTATGYLLADYSFFDTRPPTYKYYPDGTHNLGSMADAPAVKQLINISEGWYVISKQENRLFFNDLRFGLIDDNPENPIFAFSYELIPSNGQVSAIEVPKTKRDGKVLLSRLINRIGGN
ncbi:MAG TPA: metal-dependent hydrolase [Flavobacterium sp.]|jgi:inner membrane protein|nr:metal-dependent hydrolase [Flavobacterium sp.]